MSVPHEPYAPARAIPSGATSRRSGGGGSGGEGWATETSRWAVTPREPDEALESAEPHSPDTPSVAPARAITNAAQEPLVGPPVWTPGVVYGWTPDAQHGASAGVVAGQHVIVPAAVAPAERGWASAAHWLPLVSHWIGPLVVLLTVGRRSVHVRAEAVASLNWEITVALLLGASALLARFGVVGPALAIGVLVLSVALHLIGAIKAARGGSFVYPLALPIVH